MAKPARPELVFTSIDDMLSDAERLKSAPYEKAGEWDLPMILDHLGKAMETPSTVMKKIPWPFDIVARLLIHRMAKRQKYPSIKFHAPKAMRPTDGILLEAAEARFRGAAEKIKSFHGPTISGTAFGTIALSDFVQLQLLHGAHHLSFLKPGQG